MGSVQMQGWQPLAMGQLLACNPWGVREHKRVAHLTPGHGGSVPRRVMPVLAPLSVPTLAPAISPATTPAIAPAPARVFGGHRDMVSPAVATEDALQPDAIDQGMEIIWNSWQVCFVAVLVGAVATWLCASPLAGVGL